MSRFLQYLAQHLARAAVAPPTVLALLLGAATTSRAEAAADTPDARAFSDCLRELRSNAGERGVQAATFDRLMQDLSPDPEVLAALDHQPEFRTPIWDYLAGLVDEERVAMGTRMLAEHADVLASVEQHYRVDPATVVAVWGVESDYGQTFGKRPLLRSLATLSCAGRRQSFFRGELYSALRILAAGDVDPAALTGSWAGAFGHTQFMPSTFERIAVDHDGDGRRDLVGSVDDALASTANYLAKSGWNADQRWGFEVALPAGFDAAGTGRKQRRPLSDWAARGIRRIDGSALVGADAPADRRAALLLPAGVEGPAFIVFRNFDAIYSYNAAESYALAIAVLSDRLRGLPGIVAPWPTDDAGLSRRERRELQQLLLALGHDIGEVDGMIGSRSRTAIAQEMERLGMAGEPRAGQRLLAALRASCVEKDCVLQEPSPPR